MIGGINWCDYWKGPEFREGFSGISLNPSLIRLYTSFIQALTYVKLTFKDVGLT
jgi:hypothetical protein